MEGWATRLPDVAGCPWGGGPSGWSPALAFPLQDWSREENKTETSLHQHPGAVLSSPPPPPLAPLLSLRRSWPGPDPAYPASRQVTGRVGMRVHCNDPDLGHPRTAPWRTMGRALGQRTFTQVSISDEATSHSGGWLREALGE